MNNQAYTEDKQYASQSLHRHFVNYKKPEHKSLSIFSPTAEDMARVSPVPSRRRHLPNLPPSALSNERGT